MKTIGLIGGTSWLSTIDYYRIINQEVNRELGGLHSAKLLLYSFDLHEFITIADAGAMEAAFFKDKLLEQGIEVMIPEADDRQFIHQTIFDELEKGLLLNETKVRYLGIMQKLIAKGAEAVILGCTEIPLLIKPEDCTVPVFDTTLIHAKAAAMFALT